MKKNHRYCGKCLDCLSIKLKGMEEKKRNNRKKKAEKISRLMVPVIVELLSIIED